MAKYNRATLSVACAILSIGQVQVSSGSIDSVALEEHATRVMGTYCISCHGAETQKGKVRWTP